MRTYVTLDASECPFLDPNSYPRRGSFEWGQGDEDIAERGTKKEPGWLSIGVKLPKGSRVLPPKDENALKELPKTWKKGLDFVWVHHIAEALEGTFVEGSNG